jgi:methylated-DNA-protein-cysteine methyltransferase-like protein
MIYTDLTLFPAHVNGFLTDNLQSIYSRNIEMPKSFFQRVIDIIKKIPEGQVITYGQIAKFAGNPRGARQVARILHSCSGKENLPWHRVINSKGCIALKHKHGYELQKQLLEEEGLILDEIGCIDLKRYLWQQ